MVAAKLPRVSLPLLDTLHEDFVNMFHNFSGERLDPGLCRRLAYNISVAFDGGVESELIFQTLMQYEGRELNDHWCALLARQIVARKGEFQEGPLHLFDRPVRDEWVMMEIIGVSETTWRGDRLGTQVEFYCLTGHPAGHTLSQKFPENWMAWLAYNIGFSKKLPYDYDINQFIGLRFGGYLVASRRDPDTLEFEDWKVNTSMKSYNQDILKRRLRFVLDLDSVRADKIEQYSCPFDFDSYCSDCSCTVRECNAAVNRERIYVGHARPDLDGATAVS